MDGLEPHRDHIDTSPVACATHPSSNGGLWQIHRIAEIRLNDRFDVHPNQGTRYGLGCRPDFARFTDAPPIKARCL